MLFSISHLLGGHFFKSVLSFPVSLFKRGGGNKSGNSGRVESKEGKEGKGTREWKSG